MLYFKNIDMNIENISLETVLAVGLNGLAVIYRFNFINNFFSEIEKQDT